MTSRKTRYEYGKCHTCGEFLREKEIKQDFWIKGKLLVVEGVPAGVCAQCGEKVVRAAVGQRIATLVQDTATVRRAKRLRVPVIAFAREVA